MSDTQIEKQLAIPLFGLYDTIEEKDLIFIWDDILQILRYVRMSLHAHLKKAKPVRVINGVTLVVEFQTKNDLDRINRCHTYSYYNDMKVACDKAAKLFNIRAFNDLMSQFLNE